MSGDFDSPQTGNDTMNSSAGGGDSDSGDSDGDDSDGDDSDSGSSKNDSDVDSGDGNLDTPNNTTQGDNKLTQIGRAHV